MDVTNGLVEITPAIRDPVRLVRDVHYQPSIHSIQFLHVDISEELLNALWGLIPRRTWSSISLEQCSGQIDAVLQLIMTHDSCRRLSLNDVPSPYLPQRSYLYSSMYAELAKGLPNLQNLQILHLDGFISDSSSALLADGLARNTSIEGLHLDCLIHVSDSFNCHNLQESPIIDKKYQSPSCSYLAQAIVRLKFLQLIAVQCYRRDLSTHELQLSLQFHLLKQLSDRAYVLPVLKLEVSDWDGGLWWLESVARVIENNKVHQLQLTLNQDNRNHDEYKERGDNIDILLQALQGNATLHTLDVSEFPVNDHEMETLVASLHHNDSLKVLNLSQNQATSFGIRLLAEFLPKCHLQVLHLAGGKPSSSNVEDEFYHITDQDLEFLIHGLKKQDLGHHLLELDLSYNRITNHGACILANALVDFNYLRRINMEGNHGIGGVGGHFLLEALQTNYVMEDLTLDPQDFKVVSEISYIGRLNRGGRRVLMNRNFPIALWPYLLKRANGMEWKNSRSPRQTLAWRSEILYHLLRFGSALV